jgi:hypothetical protein
MTARNGFWSQALIVLRQNNVFAKGHLITSVTTNTFADLTHELDKLQSST